MEKTLLATLMQLAYEIEIANEADIHPDFAMQLLENIAAGLQMSERAKITKIIEAWAIAEDDPNRAAFFKSFSDDFGLRP